MLASISTVFTCLSRGTQVVWVMLWKCKPHTWQVYMVEQCDTLERPSWPHPLTLFIKQLVLLRWEQPVRVYDRVGSLFLSPPRLKVLRHLDVWPPWGQNFTGVRRTWNQKLNWTSWRVEIPPSLSVFSVTLRNRDKTEAKLYSFSTKLCQYLKIVTEWSKWFWVGMEII